MLRGEFDGAYPPKQIDYANLIIPRRYVDVPSVLLRQYYDHNYVSTNREKQSSCDASIVS